MKIESIRLKNFKAFKEVFMLEEPSAKAMIEGILPKITLVPEYQKINSSRMIAPYLNLENTRSLSFYKSYSLGIDHILLEMGKIGITTIIGSGAKISWLF